MKKVLFSFVIAGLLILSSCAGTKEISVPCTEKGHSDAQFFRASNSAKSRDMSSAKDKALITAKQMLASLIGSSMKSLTDNYMSQNSNDKAASQKFETITRELVNQQLKNISVSCEKTQKNKDGNYESFVAVEMPKSTVISSFINQVSSDPTLKAGFDETKFKQMADKELDKTKQ